MISDLSVPESSVGGPLFDPTHFGEKYCNLFKNGPLSVRAEQEEFLKAC